MDRATADIDLRLIDRILKGDQEAFPVLVTRHRRAIFSLVYHLVGDREAAEEVALEVFLQAYVSLSRFRRQAKFRTWLHRIAVNVALQYLRQPRVRQALSEVPLNEEGSLASSDPAALAIGLEMAAQVTAAMQELPHTLRAAVILHYLQELSSAEIGEMLSIPESTARTRVFNGTRLLRDRLRALGIVPARQESATL